MLSTLLIACMDIMIGIKVRLYILTCVPLCATILTIQTPQVYPMTIDRMLWTMVITSLRLVHSKRC
jgi:hypothetical protein